MKSKLLLASVAFLFAVPAFAGSTTIEFANDNGQTYVLTLEDGTATSADGSTASYTYDADSATMCFDLDEGERCVTFDNPAEEATVGHVSTYSTSDGGTGTATITAVE